MNNPTITIDQLAMSDEEFADDMRFEIWCKRNRGAHGRNIRLGEALHVFRENVIRMCYQRIHAHQNEEHWRKLLREVEEMDNYKFQEKIRRAKECPIENVVAEYGFEIRQHKICCPFHGEKTPSLHIYTNNNTWHCFGCHVGGDTIDFVMQMRKCDFKEAVNHLA